MGKYQKVDRYLKDVKNGNEEALIKNIEEQQKQREEEKKKERGVRVYATENSEKKKTKKKEGILDKNRNKYLKIVQLEK